MGQWQKEVKRLIGQYREKKSEDKRELEKLRKDKAGQERE